MSHPDFLVIGAQKAGTTWLDKMFKSHPDIWTPVVKELQFFNEKFLKDVFPWTQQHRVNHAKSAISYAITGETDCQWDNIKQAVHIADSNEISYEWYEVVFDYAEKGMIKGEMTPEYSLLDYEHVQEIQSRYPNLKIIFVMRDPVQRALSGIKMRLLQEGFDDSSDQQEIDEFVLNCSKDWDVIERGNYKNIINIWSSVFGESNFLTLLSDELKNEPVTQLKMIGDFLNVDEHCFSADPSERIHVGKSFHISEEVIKQIEITQSANSEWFSEFKLRR
ncbi:MAG: hypothetical protein CL679_13125 [Bermanella sp.]|nr:hypothetical protein [Bermanella sp.]|tara:strand:- start:622 stop:1452 length:831 start_codon:yes stop_codon:yes gene_type:complete